MSANLIAELEAYRATARAWLETQVETFGTKARHGLNEAEDLALGRRWMARKYEQGYSGISWPKEFGGMGLTPLHQAVFTSEELLLNFPSVYFGISLGQPVPIMMHYAPKDVAQRFIVPALKGEEIWCQLFSEPAGGSDLAGLRTRATRDGDDWVITGQKLWTSWAQYSDYAVLVARHDPSLPKHQGLTYFWLDMRSPGITVRPVKLADGGHDVNEVFFDEVRIPDSQRLGEVGQGFAVSMHTLFIERYSAAADETGFGPELSSFVDLASRTPLGNGRALDDGRVRAAITEVFRMQQALATVRDKAFLELANGQEPGAEGSIHKLVAVRSRQRLSELGVDLMGPGAIFDEANFAKTDWVSSWLSAPTGRIAGGTDEILLNTIAEKILGLPQDYRPDKGVPFDKIA
ncbi:MAG TPA: acyl-CoA dehydrogenase family protein [Novosphingobium sp.]|nr:acyl-CoA dehydrogenase family protein [Novosphingobium sp.]